MASSRSQARENTASEDQRQDKKKVNPLILFQYSTCKEKFWITLGILLAIVSGFMPCLINILYGEFCNMMIDRQFPSDAPSTETYLLPWFGGGRILQDASESERKEALIEDSVAWGIGCAFFTLLQFFFTIISVFLLCYMAYRQVSRIKVFFFKSVLCKDLAWYETRMTGNFAVETSENLFLAEKSIADVLSIFTFQLTLGLINVLISFLTDWQLSLVLVAFVIPVFVSALFKAKLQTRLLAEEMTLYSKAGSVAEEVFSSVKTVVAFGGEKKEIERYSNFIEKTKKYCIKRGLISGLSNAIAWLIIYSAYSVAFFYGIRLLEISSEDDSYNFTPGDLLIVLFAMLTAFTNIGYATNQLETFSMARGAVGSVFEVINTKSKINPCSDEGSTGDDCQGEIEFQDVYFEYPSRHGMEILSGLNLKIKAGEIVAIVGPSGGGKSTLLQLVQRLYDPVKGQVLLDGQNLKSLKVSWLRQQLGVVGQEPLLFSTTIRENILFGNMEASEEDIIKAAEEAKAHDFIMQLHDDYNTHIGQKGSTLSGGQKQRIAIARALIRNPKILLLDEATSALDAESEMAVQAALDRAAIGRTTLIVTHRLSTITNVDRIIVIDKGIVQEDGTHDDLVKADGIYNKLLKSQEENIKVTKNRAVKPPSNIHPGVVHDDIIDDMAVLPPDPRGRIGSIICRGSRNEIYRVRGRYKRVGFCKLFTWCSPEWGYVTVGILASILGGAALPVVCVLFGDLFGLLSLSDFDIIEKRTNVYALGLLGVALGAGICVLLQMYCFTVAGTRLTCRLRIKAFTCIIHQEIGYFDKEDNKVGALCVRLSKDPSEIQGTMGIRLGILIQALATMLIGIALSFFFNWKITLVATATLPLVFAGVYLESLLTESVQSDSSELASKIAVEVLANIKAVASLGKESYFIKKYSEAIWHGKNKSIRKALLRGFAFAIGQTAPFFSYAITLWYGGILIASEDVHYKYIIMISELIIFGAWTVGQSVVTGPSFGQTKIAANRLNYIFTRKPRVVDGSFTFPSDLNENQNIIRYSRVNFHYPVRPRVKILRKLNLKIQSGQSVAVMGPSGCGKSTVIQLIQRFYDPTSGSVSIGKVDIRNYTLSSLRKAMGLVSQEPVLFNRTIRENIAYGDNTRVVPLSEIIEAAQTANIHSFIESLPQGYDTNLGAGTLLSGGQKQRIAISRALVRKPQILLLDEATSALDPQSESLVQDALDKASQGRTTITVAHRLRPAKNADLIYVVKRGAIKEFGTHDELMKLKGIYYSMHEGQVWKDGRVDREEGRDDESDDEDEESEHEISGRCKELQKSMIEEMKSSLKLGSHNFQECLMEIQLVWKLIVKFSNE